MKKQLFIAMGVLVVILVITSAFTLDGRRHGQRQVSRENVYWNWEFPDGDSVGKSRLIRYPNRIRADYFTSGLPGGQADTLWFIVFNYPELCTPAEGGCSFDDLGANRAAQGDFLLADGRVIREHGYAYFRGSLKVGDTSGSGMTELTEEGCLPDYPGCGGPAGLVNPAGALVNLAVHSHGPALTGQELEHQLNSFTGGCEVFLGPGGFASQFDRADTDGDGVYDDGVPVDVGECSTIQQSVHIPE